MTGFWGVTKWGQTRDKLCRDVTKFLAHARNRTTTRFLRVEILSHFCPRCDKFCHNSLIHQSILSHFLQTSCIHKTLNGERYRLSPNPIYFLNSYCYIKFANLKTALNKNNFFQRCQNVLHLQRNNYI